MFSEEETQHVARVRVSTCELAYALARGHAEESALALTNQHFGADPATARVMLAAGSSGLRAHGLCVEEADGALRLVPLLDEAVTRMTTATHLVQCHRTADANETLALHCAPRGVVRHVQPAADVHELALVTTAEALQQAAAFFAVPDEPAIALDPVLVPHPVVAAVRDTQDQDTIGRQLSMADVPPSAAALLAEDLAKARFRGTVVRLEPRPDSASHAENRLFILAGAVRVWLLTVVDSQGRGMTRFELASRPALHDLLGPALRDTPAAPVR